MKPIEILRTGTHPATPHPVTITAEDLAAIALAFNEAGKPLPFVAGHPKENQPQFGFGRHLRVDGERLLVDEVFDLDPTFAAIVNSGELNQRSVKLQFPGHPDNPFNTYRLVHVGFLGSTRPAIPDLATAELAANPLEIEFAYCPDATGSATKSVPDQEDPMLETPSPAPDREAEFAARQQALERLEAEFKAREAALLARERAAARQAIADRLTRLTHPRADGTAALTPGQVPLLLEVVCALNPQDVQFQQGDLLQKDSPVELLFQFLEGLKQVSFAETALASQTISARDEQAIAKAIRQIIDRETQAGRKISYIDAYVEALQGGR